MRLLTVPLMFALTLATLVPAEEPAKAPEGEYTPLFNGKDLTGWVNVNCAPGTFFAKDGEIITTGRPTGFLRTAKQYENFVLEMDWMHENKKDVGNSGLFVWGDPLPAVGTGYTRGIEVQVLVNLNVKDTYTSHGDLFSIWGAKCKPDRPHPKGWERCLPSENLCKGGGEWNHYKVTGNDGVLKLEVNGKEVSGVSQANPRKGYLALESEGAVCHFKNIKIRELPSTNPKPAEIANLDKGHKSLFDGLTFEGWKLEKDAWKASDGVVRSVSESKLTTAGRHGSCELLFDYRLAAKSDAKSINVEIGDTAVSLPTAGGKWQRAVVSLDLNQQAIQAAVGGKAVDVKLPAGLKLAAAPITIVGVPGLELRSLFRRELTEKK